MNVSIQRPAVVISVAANLVTPRKVTAYFSVVPREPELMGGSDEIPRLIARVETVVQCMLLSNARAGRCNQLGLEMDVHRVMERNSNHYRVFRWIYWRR